MFYLFLCFGQVKQDYKQELLFNQTVGTFSSSSFRRIILKIPSSNQILNSQARYINPNLAKVAALTLVIPNITSILIPVKKRGINKDKITVSDILLSLRE
jgi:hypothetical protein